MNKKVKNELKHSIPTINFKVFVGIGKDENGVEKPALSSSGRVNRGLLGDAKAKEIEKKFEEICKLVQEGVIEQSEKDISSDKEEELKELASKIEDALEKLFK